MKKEFAIVEIGSTNTKGYVYRDGNIKELEFCNINFKKNFHKNRIIIDSDKKLLLNYLNKINKETKNIYVYGTSIFRNLDKNQLIDFKNWLNNSITVKFYVVSSENENKYTVNGIIRNITTDDNIAVLIGGGGSTEIGICRKGHILEQANSSFGVVDIQEAFPSLINDITEIDFYEVVDYVKDNLKFPSLKAKTLILAGGDFILRYEKAAYPVEKNVLFSDNNCPYMIAIDKNIKHDILYFNNISLNSLRKSTPNNPKWWDGTRAMCACVDAVADEIGAKILVPTKVSMIYGIIEEILRQDL